MFRRHRRIPIAALALFAVLQSACAQGPAAWSGATRARIARPPACVTIFFVDGLDTVEAERLLQAGALPNIQKHFVAGGVRVRSAAASLPPITYANAVAILTGRFPGHHGILGNQWFDRDACLLRDYGFAARYRQVNEDFTAPTLYELLADEFTVSVQNHTRRGVSATLDNWARSGVDWYLDNYSDVDARVGTCFPWVAEQARRAGRWPVVYCNYFPGTDEHAHAAGADSPVYAQALAVVDQAIGRIIADVEAAAIADRRYYLLLSDHGHVPLDASCRFDLQGWLEVQHHRRVRGEACQSGGRIGRCGVLAGYDTVLLADASRRAVIHLRGDTGWSAPANPALTDRLVGWPFGPDADGIAQQPQVLVACTRAGPDAVRVVSRAAAARVERRVVDGCKEYRLVPADPTVAADPLGYRENSQLAAFIDAGWHAGRAWLAATAAEDVRDLVPQVVEMFDSPRAGDIVVFTAGRCTLEAGPLGGHGSCLARDLQIPLYFAGPGLPAGGEIPTGRLVDVMPTVLDLLGKAERLEQAGPIDGVSLLPELRAAAPAR